MNIKKPFIVTVMSTKGGVTKSTNVANISAFCAECGLKTLMIDTDVQPTLSSYYPLKKIAPQGLFEFLIQYQTDVEKIISQTIFPNLDIIQSNDPIDAISNHLRSAPDGMLRFNDLVRNIEGYDLILIDTRGTRGITVDMACLASDLILSPLKPELLSAREFMRGTLTLYKQLQIFTRHGFTLPPVKAVINCLDNTNDAKNMVTSLQQLFSETNDPNLQLLDFTIPSRVAYREAASLALPVHQHSRKEKETIKTLCTLLFPQWKEKFSAI
ncbi:chromosome partitioning protein ParA [Actinobacillus delphinicola]|uniref:ParA family protein n=1 Tax=Actinobacillus delphinicola TaxID=51161 RepID=UPI0024414194|nr:ParA family protein [Actinobacillus delphinicola]MDG6897848.1 chromosome partitioning protein ParA [Actinobacillus delphinicola]